MSVAVSIFELLGLGFTGVLVIFFFIQRGRAFHAINNALNNSGPSPAFDQRIEWLRNNRLVLAYRTGLQHALNWIAQVIGDDRRAAAHRRTGADWRGAPAGTFRSYLFVLGLAVFYPVFFLTGGWVFGSQGELGGLAILDGTTPEWQRILLPASFLSAAAMGVIAGRLAKAGRSMSAMLVFCLAGAAAIAVASVFAIAVSIAGALAAAGVVAGAGAFAVAVAAAFIFAGVFAVIDAVASLDAGVTTVAVAVVVALLLAFALKRLRLHWVWAWPFALGLPIAVLALLAVDGSSEIVDIRANRAGPWILFFALLPAANALLDWPSLTISRWLLNRIADGRHGWFMGLLLAFADLVIALVFFLLMAVTAAGMLTLAEHLHSLGGAEPLVDASSILDGIRAHPLAADYVWIYFMLLTTLVPTAIHFIAALMSGATFVFAAPIRSHLIRLMEAARKENDTDKAWWSAIYYSLVQTAGLAVAVYGLYWTGRLVYENADHVGIAVLDACEQLAALIESWDGRPFFS